MGGFSFKTGNELLRIPMSETENLCVAVKTPIGVYYNHPSFCFSASAKVW